MLIKETGLQKISILRRKLLLKLQLYFYKMRLYFLLAQIILDPVEAGRCPPPNSWSRRAKRKV